MLKENNQKYYLKTGSVLSSYRAMDTWIKDDVDKFSGKN
jgi:hypothetical protein